eukprot:9817228-Alexandrium_andersonii.AAC.1
MASRSACHAGGRMCTASFVLFSLSVAHGRKWKRSAPRRNRSRELCTPPDASMPGAAVIAIVSP